MPLSSAAFVAKHNTIPGISARPKRSLYRANNARTSSLAVRPSANGRLEEDGAARRCWSASISAALKEEFVFIPRHHVRWLYLLEHELQRKLHLPRIFSCEDMIEARRTDIAVGQPEVSTVEEIKQLCSELELLRFRHFEVFERCEIPVRVCRPIIHVTTFCSKLPSVGYGIEPLIGACVKP